MVIGHEPSFWRLGLVELTRFWNEAKETKAPADRESEVLHLLQGQLRRAYEGLPFYRRHYDAHGFHPDQVKTLADFSARVPIITKQMLRDDQAAFTTLRELRRGGCGPDRAGARFFGYQWYSDSVRLFETGLGLHR